MSDRSFESWHGLTVKDVEQRLNTPGAESSQIRAAYEWAVEGVQRYPRVSLYDRYIQVGGFNLRELQDMTVQNWGWHPSDKTWYKVPIGGNLGRQWGLLLRSQIPQTNLRINMGLWIPETPNQGLYAIHSEESSPAVRVKIAVIAHAMWVHALEQNGRFNILSEWGIRSREDSSSRDPLAALFDPRPESIPRSPVMDLSAQIR